MSALEITGLSVRYGRSAWGLRDCSLTVPSGRVAALVGPNGAGKSTLLHTIVGLRRPTRGEVRTRGEIGFVAQQKPLYDGFTVAETLRFGCLTNQVWDAEGAERRLDALGIPRKRKVGTLSGGQQAQIALTLALARRPSLLVLDEPLASLDPLARHDVMRLLMSEVAERELTVLLSSHVVTDLENTCDWLVVLNGGRVQVCGDIDDLLDGHVLASGPAELAPRLAEGTAPVADSRTGRQATLLLNGTPPLDPRWSARPPTLDELVLGYLRNEDSAALPRPLGVSA